MRTHLSRIGGQGFSYAFPQLLSAFIFPDKISLFFRAQQISLASWLGKCKDLSVSMPSALGLQIHNTCQHTWQSVSGFFFFSNMGSGR